MNNQSVFRKTILAASIAMLTACGGSGGTPADTSTTSGVITAFGSIYINGVEYETGTASINIDGALLPETQLGVGDVCVIEGSVNTDGTTGTAVSVVCADELEGFVLDLTDLDLTTGTGTINVMGQTVTINLDTVFEGDGGSVDTINKLNINDIIEVSGFSDGKGTILATRVETKDGSDDEVEIKGVVSMLADDGSTFMIGGMTVDLLTAPADLSEVEVQLADGLLVEVKTDVAIVTNDDGSFTMIASKVEVEEDGDKDIDGDEGDEIKVQGVVSEVNLDAVPATFLFNGQLVVIDHLDDDFDTSTLMDGMMLTVEGYIDDNGDFVIEEIEEENETENEVEGTVTAVTETTLTVLEGEVATTFTVNNDTRMIDEKVVGGVEPSQYFSLADVVEGDNVEVEFYVDKISGDNIATELKREDDKSEMSTVSTDTTVL